MKPLKLSQRLFIISVVALLPAVGILFSSIGVSQEENDRAVHIQAARTSEQAALEMDRVISGAENVLRALSVTPIVRRGDLEICSRLVSDMAAAVPSLSAIAVINPDGYFRCGPVEARPPPYLGDRQYFVDALKTRDRIVGTFTIGRSSGNKLLPIALQIGGDGEAPLGVAVAYIDLAWLEARMLERTYVAGSSLTIADRNGTILARVPEPERFVGTDIPPDFRHLLTMPKPGTVELTSQDGTRRVLGYVPVADPPLGLYVSAGYATDAAFASTQQIFTRGVVIGLIGVLCTLLLATYTTKVFIARPIQTLVDTIQAWRAGQTDVRTGMNAKDGELGSAGQALDDFIEELLAARQAREDIEKQRHLLFAEMDHRGKNMLSIILAVTRRTFARVANEPEMQIFSSRLRAIGDASSELRREHWHSANLERLIKTALTPFVDPQSTRITLSGPDILVHSDVVLPLGMVFHELCTNAVKYGALSVDTGTVSVEWAVSAPPAGDRFQITWQERGGPTVAAPQKRGFGSSVIEHNLTSKYGGKTEMVYDPKGLVCRMTLPTRHALATEPSMDEHTARGVRPAQPERGGGVDSKLH